MLPGEEIAFTPYGAQQHRGFDLQEYSRRGCEIKGSTRQLLSNSLSMFVQDPNLEMMVILHEDHTVFGRFTWTAVVILKKCTTFRSPSTFDRPLGGRHARRGFSRLP